jgi:serine/threonine protein kinase
MRELIESVEAWDFASGDPAFHHTAIIWKEGDNYYQFNHPERTKSFDLDSLPATTPIPMHIFKGPWHASFTELSPLIPTDSFLKRPCIRLSSDKLVKPDSLTPGDHLVEEAKIYEILKHHPHPNICVYYGCVREGDYLTDICLKKYGRTLMKAVWGKDPTLNHAAIMSGISKGLQFLHETLGLVHNDINPSNIMLDDAGDPVIVDFDSCMPIGEKIGRGRKMGSFGWTLQPLPTISLPENDIYGLTQIGELLAGRRT